MGNCALGLGAMLVNKSPYHLLWYQVRACTWECLQLRLMLSRLRPSLLFITSQGLKQTPFELQPLLFIIIINLFSILHFSYLFFVSSHFRTSQFIIGLNKYLEAINHDFGVGMRFKMRFEGDDSPERRLVNIYRHQLHSWYIGKFIWFTKSSYFLCAIRFSGTIVGVEDMSPHWNDSKWRTLKVCTYSDIPESVVYYWRLKTVHIFSSVLRFNGMNQHQSQGQKGFLHGR